MSLDQENRLAQLSEMQARLGARMYWQHKGPPDTDINRIDLALVNQRLVVFFIYQEGWEYFIQGSHNNLINAEEELRERTATTEPDPQTVHDHVCRLAQGMRGGFAAKLAESWLHADNGNQKKLTAAFPDLFTLKGWHD